MCRRRGTRIALVLALLALLCLIGLPGALAEQNREERIKAAFVYKLAKFIDWPQATFPGPDAPLNVCLLGPDAFADTLASIRGRKVHGRPVTFAVVLPAGGERFAQCHILYLPHTLSREGAAVLRSLAGRPVLTIGDQPGFAQAGGMIGLVRSGNRISFQINRATAERAGLAVRAQLLELADLVGSGARP
jgi:hypothetical protein